MTKSSKIREDIIKNLNYSRQLDAMEHFLDQQFRNIKSDQAMIRKYILEAVAYLEKCNKDLVINENETNKKDSGSSSFISPDGPVS